MTKKILISILVVLIVAVAIIAFARVATGEDNWICVSGEWVKHGNPSRAMPDKECPK